MIVDDSLETIDNIKSCLQKEEGFEVIGEAQNTEDALDIISNKMPNIVITEIVLKGADGFELMEKALDKSRQTKFFVLSSLSQETFVEKAMKLGAVYYMAKPFKPDNLVKRLKDVETLSKSTFESSNKSGNRELDEKISNIFITVGIPAHIKGYQFLREAIKLAINKPDILNSLIS